MSDQNPFRISLILCECGAKIALVHADQQLDRVTWRRFQKATARNGFNLTHLKKCVRCGQEIESSPAPGSVDSITEYGDPTERLLTEMKVLIDKAILLDALRNMVQEFDEQRRKLAAQSKVL